MYIYMYICTYIYIHIYIYTLFTYPQTHPMLEFEVAGVHQFFRIGGGSLSGFPLQGAGQCTSGARCGARGGDEAPGAAEVLDFWGESSDNGLV
jgi:hypothetical protein